MRKIRGKKCFEGNRNNKIFYSSWKPWDFSLFVRNRKQTFFFRNKLPIDLNFVFGWNMSQTSESSALSNLEKINEGESGKRSTKDGEQSVSKRMRWFFFRFSEDVLILKFLTFARLFCLARQFYNIFEISLKRPTQPANL